MMLKPRKNLFVRTEFFLLLTQFRGGGERDRTDDLLRARQALSQLSYTPTLISMVGLDGLEPSTSRLSGVRSNQN